MNRAAVSIWRERRTALAGRLGRPACLPAAGPCATPPVHGTCMLCVWCARRRLVLDYAEWVEHLPHSIEAVFMPAGASDAEQAHARTVHSAFLRAYCLAAEEVPLVVYDPLASLGEPFRLASEQGDDGDLAPSCEHAARRPARPPPPPPPPKASPLPPAPPALSKKEAKAWHHLGSNVGRRR